MGKLIKLYTDKKCSYCGRDLGKDAKYFYRFHGKPSYYQCTRRVCRFLIFIGINSTKKAIKRVEDQARREELLKKVKKQRKKK